MSVQNFSLRRQRAWVTEERGQELSSRGRRGRGKGGGGRGGRGGGGGGERGGRGGGRVCNVSCCDVVVAVVGFGLKCLQMLLNL